MRSLQSLAMCRDKFFGRRTREISPLHIRICVIFLDRSPIVLAQEKVTSVANVRKAHRPRLAWSAPAHDNLASKTKPDRPERRRSPWYVQCKSHYTYRKNNKNFLLLRLGRFTDTMSGEGGPFLFPFLDNEKHYSVIVDLELLIVKKTIPLPIVNFLSDAFPSHDDMKEMLHLQ